jgi:hypothetical protein
MQGTSQRGAEGCDAGGGRGASTLPKTQHQNGCFKGEGGGGATPEWSFRVTT